MRDKTIDWIKVICSILLFNLLITGFIWGFKLANVYTISLKILLDITIAFVSDKTINKLKINFKDGFFVERDNSNNLS